ncbi:MAG: tetratricopeptide repeat protein [Planctomycetota bacterium]|jgi:tetratricopeptide (TPR) repeat protein
MVSHKRYRNLLGMLAVLLAAAHVLAAGAGDLRSQDTAQVFVKQASEIYAQDRQNAANVEQAMVLLDAAVSLDAGSASIPEQILRVGSGACYGQAEYEQMLMWSFDRYVTERADLEVIAGAVRCMLNNLNSRMDREALLGRLMKRYAGSNHAMGSEIATQLGLLAAEKADLQTAITSLSQAYELNRYNQLAYMKLLELSAGQNLSVTPVAGLGQMRSALDINPYDLEITTAYAEALCFYGLYEPAVEAYAYAARLHAFTLPGEPLTEAIYLPWIQCAYKIPRQSGQCLELANRFRDPETFDLMLEAVAGKAMVQAGQVEKGKATLSAAAAKAEKLLLVKGLTKPIYSEQLAWFYSFVLQMPEKALAWSNQAFQEAPDRQGVRSIFAYTLASSGQAELAGQFAEATQNTDQIASLTMAIVQLSQDQKDEALASLKRTIEMAPESFVAEKALRVLTDQGVEYEPTVQPAMLQASLEKAFGPQLVPGFTEPAKLFAAKLLFGGEDFSYGVEMSPRLVIENTGSSPLVINDGALLGGHLRVDVQMTGDLNVEIPNLVNMKYRPSRPIQPGEHLSISLNLDTGKLRGLLMTYPQAKVQLNFTAYLDPIQEKDGNVVNGLVGTDPVTQQIQRTGVVLSRDFLMQRLDALAKGQQGQKLQAVELFAGLLAEQKAFELSQANFRHLQVDQTILVDAVRRALVDENWKVRIQALESMLSLSIPLEYGLVREVSQNLDHDKWPVRMMAMILLAKSQPGTFSKVLDWKSQYDPYFLNRRMAVALGGKLPKPTQDEPKP